MASFEDDGDVANGSGDEFDNEDEEMEDVNDATQEDGDQGAEDDGDDDEDEDNDDDDNDDDDNDNEDDEDDERDHAGTPLRRTSRRASQQHSPSKNGLTNPAVILTSPSPHGSTVRSPGMNAAASWIPPVRPEALHAQAYDIVPTMAAPQSTSINAIAATADMKWVFTGGADGYVRMFNWVETANGKVPLTVAQKHPFVDSVMKAGSLLTYWENEEAIDEWTAQKGEDSESKWLSPVYSLAVQHQAIWLLSGLESGAINLQTCRHQAGSRIATLKEHTSAVSVLNLSQDETNLLSGSWDKCIHEWDLNIGKVKRSFRRSGGQISAIETRPMSDITIPEIADLEPFSDTFSTNNADQTALTESFVNGGGQTMRGDEDDPMGSPSGSLFGEGDHGSLFGEDSNAVGGGNVYADDEDALTHALENGLHEDESNDRAVEDLEVSMEGITAGGPVQPPTSLIPPAESEAQPESKDGQEQIQYMSGESLARPDPVPDPAVLTHGLPHTDGMITAPPTGDDEKSTAADLPPQSESTFLDASFDGTLRVWDRRVPTAIATIAPYGGTPPWCMGACWSPDGNYIYAGRRNCTVDEYSIHKLSTNRNKPERTFRFQAGSGPVYAVRAMPNSRHLVCASQDILRLYDLAAADSSRHRTGPPFTIVPGHRGGVLSAVHVDPTCRFMLSAAGNRGWESTAGTEVLLGYEIGSMDSSGVWHR